MPAPPTNEKQARPVARGEADDDLIQNTVYMLYVPVKR